MKTVKLSSFNVFGSGSMSYWDA